MESTQGNGALATARPSRRSGLPRLGRVAAVAAAGAVVVNLGFFLWLQGRRSPAPPLSSLFRNPQAIRELQSLAADLPRDPEVHQNLGTALLQQGHYLSALESLKEALRLGAPERPVRRALAAAYAGADRYEEALKELERARALEPRELDLVLQVAGYQVSLGDPAAARKTLDAVTLDADGFPTLTYGDGREAALERLAGAYGELGEYRRSLEMARRVLADGPNRPSANLVAGRALLELGQGSPAARHLEQVERLAPGQPELLLLLVRAWKLEGSLRNEDRVLAALEKVARTPSASGQVFLDLGIIYQRRKQWEKAGDAFKQAYEAKTDPEVSLAHAYSCYQKAGRVEDALYLEGLLYENRGQFGRAIEQYRKLTRIHSCCHSGYMHIARVQGKMGRYREALATLQTARKIAGAPAKLYVELARAYHSLGQPDRERAMWNEFIRLDAENADLGYQNLGVLADKAGRIDEAEQLYRKCVELQPQADLYWLKLGRLLIQRRTDPRRLRDGIAALEKAVQLAPLQSGSVFDLATAYRYAGRNQEALWAARHSVDLDPGDGRGYQQIGDLLLQAGRRAEGEEAMAYFRRFRQYYQAWETLRARVRRNPRDVSAKLRMAQFYERSGSMVNAANTYAEILQLRPSDQEAQRRLLAIRDRIRAESL